jgi:CDGSH-type Zn-finger protein
MLRSAIRSETYLGEAANVLRVSPNGPSVVTGDVVIHTRNGPRKLETAVLCRCGHSADKPFCDGAHARMGFEDPARMPDAIVSAPVDTGTLTITPIPNGPNRCDGPLTVQDIDGREASATTTFLCRCGGSRRKPYCDGTHKKNGFAA